MDRARDAVKIDQVELECIAGNQTELGRVYFQLEKEKSLDYLFWDRDIDMCLYLDTFVSMFCLDGKHSLYIAKHQGDILGCFTLSDYIKKQRLTIGSSFFRRYWGDIPAAVSSLMLSETHKALEIPKIFAFTPWRMGASICERVGMKRVGLITKYANGKDVNVFLSEV